MPLVAVCPALCMRMCKDLARHQHQHTRVHALSAVLTGGGLLAVYLPRTKMKMPNNANATRRARCDDTAHQAHAPPGALLLL